MYWSNLIRIGKITLSKPNNKSSLQSKTEVKPPLITPKQNECSHIRPNTAMGSFAGNRIEYETM